MPLVNTNHNANIEGNILCLPSARLLEAEYVDLPTIQGHILDAPRFSTAFLLYACSHQVVPLSRSLKVGRYAQSMTHRNFIYGFL